MTIGVPVGAGGSSAVKSHIAFRSDDGTVSEVASEDETGGKDAESRVTLVASNKEQRGQDDTSSSSSSSGTQQNQPRLSRKSHGRQLSQVKEAPANACSEITIDPTPLHQRFEERRLSLNDSPEVRTPDRPSFFGRISRTVSGSLYHSVATEAPYKDSPVSELSREEQTCRFWSRSRSDSGSTVSLLREVQKDIGAGTTIPVTAVERATASRMLIKEINKISRLVLQQYCSNGHPLNVELYPLSKILHLYEDAFGIGLRPDPLFQPTVRNMYLSDFEKIVPKGNATPYAVLAGIQAIYPHERLGVALVSDVAEQTSRFQQWLKTCLIDSCLGERIEMALSHQDFLQGWYYPQAIVIDEDLVQELIATCRGLDAIEIDGAREQKSSKAKPVDLPPDSTTTGNTPSKDTFSKVLRIEEGGDNKHVVQGENMADDISSVAPLSPDTVDTRAKMNDGSEENNSEEEWLTTQIEGMHLTSRGMTGSIGDVMLGDDYGICSPMNNGDMTQTSPSASPTLTTRHREPMDEPVETMRSAASQLWNRSDGGVQRSAFSSQELPIYQQITMATAQVRVAVCVMTMLRRMRCRQAS